ncbi:hypothetical protein CANCADRAFT_138328 [Tortispora caseinolytica NRRL Y-17796]|uniref:Sec1-like protein n=1 Tax=Tortispora caseinolytica NRRL Y-17796 TaxID=767744 RepID=A0A1E4TC64_9ASCO|nr:hypothetical protein CANCADRAFT_138328 [Tortispora caseinolytica NRRL Y-17796]
MSLRELARSQVINALDAVKPANKYKFLVVDDYVYTLLSALFGRDELLNYNITVMSKLTDNRPSESSFEVVYLMAPTDFNIEIVSVDFSISPKRYAACHFVLTQPLPEHTEAKLSKLPVANHIKSMQQIYVDFIVHESNVFSFNDHLDIHRFYHRKCLDLVVPAAQRAAERLASLCALVGEYPIVRFYQPADTASFDAATLPSLLASNFQEAMDATLRANPQLSPNIESGRARSVFLILDRAVDYFAPLLHEFTFQAMAYDILGISPDDNSYTYKYVNAKGRSERVTAQIDPYDSEWTSLRHKHMQEVSNILLKSLDKMKQENPDFFNTSSGPGSVSQIQDMLANVHIFNDTRDKFSLYLQLAQDCMKAFNERELDLIAQCEQSCATNEAPDGSTPRNLATDLVNILANPQVSSSDRARLIAIYLLYRNGLCEADIKKLSMHSQIRSQAVKSLQNLKYIGAPVLKDLGEKHPQKHTHLGFGEPSTEDVFETSRYVHGVSRILEAQVNGTLSTEQFPYFREAEQEEISLAHSGSMRNPRQRAAWAKSPDKLSKLKQRIFVFIPGGITFSEMKAVYEIGEKYNKEIYIGGSCIHTPKSFMDDLYHLHMQREMLLLPEDGTTEKVPEYLRRPNTTQSSQSEPHLAGSYSHLQSGQAPAPASVSASALAPASAMTSHDLPVRHNSLSQDLPKNNEKKTKKKSSRLARMFK